MKINIFNNSNTNDTTSSLQFRRLKFGKKWIIYLIINYIYSFLERKLNNVLNIQDIMFNDMHSKYKKDRLLEMCPGVPISHFRRE